MKQIAALTLSLLCSVHTNLALAEPVRCTVDGRIVYTDDAAQCGKSESKPVKGNISTFPKIQPSAVSHAGISSPGAAQNAVNLPAMPEAVLQQFGVSQQDLNNGWQTIMDAQKRGAWAAPVPDDVR